jgi:hypothetical protein
VRAVGPCIEPVLRRTLQCRRLRRLPTTLLLVFAVLGVAATADAQDPPPRIGPFALDFHATVPRFPGNDNDLALSRELALDELPGRGWGLHGGVHVYPFSWRAVTFGFGVDATAARTHKAGRTLNTGAVLRDVTETFTHIAPELSLNFGDGDGWSYLSAGVGPSAWRVDVEGRLPVGADSERLQTTNWGGGARWFIKQHLAFSLDVRVYDINPSSPVPDTDQRTQPRIRMLIIGAGISMK